jgi:hypothetical protein
MCKENDIQEKEERTTRRKKKKKMKRKTNEKFIRDRRSS